jgi:acetyl esterase
VIGSLETHDSVCRRLAHLTGLPVVAVDYRLAPEHPFPAAYLDARTAVGWLRDVAPERGWDPERIVVVGDSAGGGIAAGLAGEPTLSVDGTRMLAQVLLYPVLDLAFESIGYSRIESGFPLTADSMRWFKARFAPKPEDAAHPWASPLSNLNDAARPPAFVVALGLDPLGAEAVEYSRRLIELGTEVELHYLPRHAHGIVTSAGRVATGERLLAEAAEFIVRHLDGDALRLVRSVNTIEHK